MELARPGAEAPINQGRASPPSGAGRLDRPILFGAALCALSAVAASAAGGGGRVGVAVALVLPLAPLLAGLRLLGPRSELAAALLLAGVPIGLGLAGAARPAAAFEPVVFGVGFVTLVAYLASVARAITARDRGLVAAEVRPRTDAPPVPRVRRRLRLYRALRWAAALGFAVPLGAAAVELGGGAAAAPALLFAVAALLGALAARAFFVDTLERHLQRDPQLGDTLRRLRRHARRGRPASLFYAAAGVALAAMAVFALRRLFGFEDGGGP